MRSFQNFAFMKYCVLFFLAAFLNYNLALAQTTRPMRIKAGEDVAQAYSPYGFYRFPQFGQAKLYFKDGGRNNGKQFNYNILSAALQFIGPKGDTLDLAGQENIDSVVFTGSTFLYNDGFMEIVATADSIALLKKIIIRTQTENIGAYGMSNSTASIVSMRTYSSGTSVYNLVLNQDIVLTEVVSWFFTGGNKNIVKATKTNLLKLLPAEKQTKAEAYLKENKTSFEKEADLKKLIAAIAG
jgi:hypothetical protein